jgi:hypothetical protein
MIELNAGCSALYIIHVKESLRSMAQALSWKLKVSIQNIYKYITYRKLGPNDKRVFEKTFQLTFEVEK